MNRIYRVIWSRIIQQWVVVSETTHLLHSGSKRQRHNLRLLATSLLLGSIAMGAQASPEGGQVVTGQGSIAQSGAATTITQTSTNLSINWQSFNVAANQTVNFVQPNASSVAVNRVIGSNQASQIAGHLNANGQVWLINPNGVQFSNSAVVNVGALIASTLDISDSQINQQQRHFSGQGTGSVVNQGQINVADGGYVAFISNVVSNQGNIVANKGAVALAAGDQVTLSFSGNQLINVVVDASTINNLAENKQLIQANGGMIVMTAGAHDSLLASVVNNSGIIEAETLSGQQGNITLQAGMTAGTTVVDGTLDASAPANGNGGTITTNAAKVDIAQTVQVTSKANNGISGTWTIDPQDYKIAASGGDLTGAQLSALLASNNIIIASTQGATAGVGDINVNDAITWSNSNSLTLNAVRNISFNSGGVVTNTGGGTLNARADINGTGTGTVVMNGGSISISGSGGGVNFYYNPTIFGTAEGFSNITNSNGAIGTSYMLVNTADELQNINNNLSDSYALGKNIDASSISNFTPFSSFNSIFDGLGYTISNLTINTNALGLGLFELLNSNAIVRNLNITNANITNTNSAAQTDNSGTGILAGQLNGTVSNVNVSGTITASGAAVGGLAGQVGAGGTAVNISNSTSNVIIAVIGSNNQVNNVGGLVGSMNIGIITHSSSTGTLNVNGNDNSDIGGLMGCDNGATISNSSSSMIVNANNNSNVGGLIGYIASGDVNTSFATGDVVGGSSSNAAIGGLIGLMAGSGNVLNSHSSGSVTNNYGINNGTGGFIGQNYSSGDISNSYSTGNVYVNADNGVFPNNIGGFIGVDGIFNNAAGAITNSYSTGDIILTASANSSISFVGGFIGNFNGSAITNSYSTGNITITNANAVSDIGGFIGIFGYLGDSSIQNSFTTSGINISVSNNASVSDIGGFIANLVSTPTLTSNYAAGSLTIAGQSNPTNVGGLIGYDSTNLPTNSLPFNIWDTSTTGQAYAIGSSPETDFGIGVSDANMRNQLSYTTAGWDFTNIWMMSTGGYPYPVFKVTDSSSGVPTLTPFVFLHFGIQSAMENMPMILTHPNNNGVEQAKCPVEQSFGLENNESEKREVSVVISGVLQPSLPNKLNGMRVE